MTVGSGVSVVWGIADLERLTADGAITTVHWTVSASDAAYKSSGYGSLALEPADPLHMIPFKDLTEAVIVGWVKDHMGPEKVQEVADALEAQIEQQRAPKVASGLPW